MTHKIKTVEMTRRIRGKNYERLRGMSNAKRLQYYREMAKRMNEEAAQLSKTKQRKPTLAQ